MKEPTNSHTGLFFYASPHALQQRKDCVLILVGTYFLVAFKATRKGGLA